MSVERGWNHGRGGGCRPRWTPRTPLPGPGRGGEKQGNPAGSLRTARQGRGSFCLVSERGRHPKPSGWSGGAGSLAGQVGRRQGKQGLLSQTPRMELTGPRGTVLTKTNDSEHKWGCREKDGMWVHCPPDVRAGMPRISRLKLQVVVEADTGAISCDRAAEAGREEAPCESDSTLPRCRVE